MFSPQDSVTRDSGVEGNLSRGGRMTQGISPSSMELPSKTSSSRNFWELYLCKYEILKTKYGTCNALPCIQQYQVIKVSKLLMLCHIYPNANHKTLQILVILCHLSLNVKSMDSTAVCYLSVTYIPMTPVPLCGDVFAQLSR